MPPIIGLVKRCWQEGRILLALLLLGAVAVTLAYQQPVRTAIPVTQVSPLRPIRLAGFHAPERSSGGISYRWTQGRASMYFPAVGRSRPWEIEWDLVGWTDPQGRPVTVQMLVQGRVVARFLVWPMEKGATRPYRYAFLVPPEASFSGDLTIDLASATFSPGGKDTRQLGLAVVEVTLVSQGGFGWPPLLAVLSFQATTVLAYVLGRLLKRSGTVASLMAGGCLLLLAVPLLVKRMWVAPYLPVVAGVAAVACLAVCLVPVLIRDLVPALARALAQAFGRATAWARHLYEQRGSFVGRWTLVDDEPDASMPGTAETASLRVRKDALAVLLLFVVVLAFFYREVFLGQVFWSGDVNWFFYPGRVILARALSHLDFSAVVWNPYIFGGYPLLAEGQIGAFYPINWAVLTFLSGSAGYTVLVVGHYFMAGLFMYMYARSVKMSWGGAMVAALAFMFQAFLLNHLCHMSLMNATLWLPLIFFFAERWVTRKRKSDLVLCGLVVGIQLLAGHPQASVITALALGGYIPFRTLCLSTQRRLRQFAWSVLCFILILLIGVTLAAVQILPEWELIQLSLRPGATLSYQEAIIYSLPPENLVTLIQPFFFGGPWQGLWGKPGFGEFGLYVGVLPVVLAAVAVLFRRNWLTIFFILLAVLSLLLALGDATPAYGLFHQIPLVSGTRVPARFAFLLSSALAVLAGQGFTFLPRIAKSGKRRWLLFFAILLLLAALALFVSNAKLMQPLRKLLQARPASPVCTRPAPGARAGAYCVFLPEVARPGDAVGPGRDQTAVSPGAVDASYYDLSPFIYLFSGALILILILIFAWKARRAAWIQALCIGLILVDMFMFTQRLTTAPLVIPPQQALADPEIRVAEFLQARGGLDRAYSIENHFSNSLAPYGIFSLDGYSPLQFYRHQGYISSLVGSGFDPLWFSLANVRYIVDYRGSLAADKAGREGLTLIYERDQVRVFERPATLPRAYVVHSARKEEYALQALLEKSFDPTEAVILEKYFDTSLLSAGGEDRVEITDYAATKVTVQVSLDGGGLLVLDDTYYPGWKAFVDGKETEIYQANYLFRAVYVPAGRHVVEFVYRPTPLYLGLAISLLALAGVAAVLIWEAIAHRRGGRSGETKPRKGEEKSHAAFGGSPSVE